MKIHTYVFQFSILVFGFGSEHITRSNPICDSRHYCTITSWHPWSSCEQNCSRAVSQLRKRFVCFDDSAFSNPTREKVLRYCNISNQIPLVERRTCERVNCLLGKVNTSIACENGSSLNDHPEVPAWIQRIEFIVLALISVIFLMTIGCVCRQCCLFWGCITDDKDGGNKGYRKRKKIAKVKVSAISKRESVMETSLVNV